MDAGPASRCARCLTRPTSSLTREFVFFGADHGEEEVEFRTNKQGRAVRFVRSPSREKAMSREPFLACALNGRTAHAPPGLAAALARSGLGMAWPTSNGFWKSTCRKIRARQVPGPLVRTLRGETIDGEMKWTETAVTHMQLKSFIARVARDAGGHSVLGVVLNDGTPLQSVEVRVDDGAWQPATMDPATSSKYSWKLFTYAWSGAAPGEHTIVSRVTDVTGKVQPTEKELETKKTFLEDNSQFPRKVMIS
jgi:hypothetical protein